jgi:dethiobiotin synthetase
MAAAAENRVLAFSTLTRWCEDKIAAAEDGAVVLIEGVGGVMSPLTPDATNLDLIKALKRPAILVTGTYLGALSHALTALETLKAHGAPVQALVLNESADSTVDFGATLATLRRFAPDVAIAPLRRGAPALELELT